MRRGEVNWEITSKKKLLYFQNTQDYKKSNKSKSKYMRTAIFYIIAMWSTVNGRTLDTNVSNAENIDQFNKFIATEIPSITKGLQGVIPASYGDCASNSPPQPCQDKGSDLFYKHKSWAYKATAVRLFLFRIHTHIS